MEESGWQALRGAVRDELEDVGEPEREWAVRTSLARRHPALLARQLANHAELERELVQAISDREGSGEPGADLKRRIMAAAFLVALRIATNIWIEEQEARPLSQIMEQALDEIARPFA